MNKDEYIEEARRLIAHAVEIMTPEQVGQWEGVGAWQEFEPEQTPDYEKLKEGYAELDKIVHNLTVGMQAALIDAHHNGDKSGMMWIYNALEGPGNLPDINDKWSCDANDYWLAHKTDPMGPCEVCGKPSGIMSGGHVACCREHLDAAKQQMRIDEAL